MGPFIWMLLACGHVDTPDVDDPVTDGGGDVGEPDAGGADDAGAVDASTDAGLDAAPCDGGCGPMCAVCKNVCANDAYYWPTLGCGEDGHCQYGELEPCPGVRGCYDEEGCW